MSAQAISKGDPERIGSFNYLADSVEHAQEYRRLDTRLCQEVMRSVRESQVYNHVYEPRRDDLWASPEFGREGWQRRYPTPLKGQGR